jgi:hypothetical protein
MRAQFGYSAFIKFMILLVIWWIISTWLVASGRIGHNVTSNITDKLDIYGST